MTPAVDPETPIWSAVTASVRGSSHERTGRPNQDSVRVQVVEGPVRGLVATVCDGHGGERYIRSDIGSRLGVEVACDVGRSTLVDLGPEPTRTQILDHLMGPVARAVLTRWTSRVLDHLSEHPFNEAERGLVGRSIDAQPLVSYGATMVMAIFGPTWVGFLQIGDGDVTVVTGDRVEAPVPGDERLVANETTSLCLPTATSDARAAAFVGEVPELVMLTSDGYANSFVSPTWRVDTGLDMLRQVRERGLDHVDERLPGWLSDSAVAGGDDVSMALVVRTVSAESPTELLPAPERITRPARRPSAGDGQGPGIRPYVLTVLAVVVAGVVGLLVGSQLGGADSVGSSGATVTSDPSSDTTPGPPDTVTTTSTTTTAPMPIGPADQAEVFTGVRSFVITFDPTRPDASNPRVVAAVAPVFGRSAELPSDWSLEGSTLVHDPPRGERQELDVMSVGTSGDMTRRSTGRIWVLEPDGVSLTGYDLSGDELGTSRLPESVLDDAGNANRAPVQSNEQGGN